MRTRTVSAVLAVLLLSVLLVTGAAADDASDAMGSVRVERTLSTAHALPGSTFRVVVRIRAYEDLIGVGLRETVPLGWTIHPIENEGAAFKRTENEWVFPAGLDANSTTVVVYELTVPPAERLFAGPLPACFDLSGAFQATLNGIEIPVEGDTTVEIVSALPIPTAVAHLIPGEALGEDRVDLRLNRFLSEEQLDRALELWATDTPVPWTGGAIIDLANAEKLVALLETCTQADEPLPISVDPELVAVRAIDTALPCDSVLLPEDCLDPGLAARQFEVTVRITGNHDAYGVGLTEWFPETWRVMPREREGLLFRPSRHEWIFPAKLKAGEILEIDYVVEVIASTTDRLDVDPGCCGDESRFVGRASSGLECSESDVTGESSVYSWNCLPVLLAISRWDVEEDRLDASLSDAITFPQVQRAVDFWLSGTPVPHACGYTVGYHMLKTIVGHWLGGVPITQPLPDSVAGGCDEIGQNCYTPVCPQDGLCQLADLQSPEDYVGIPPTPSLAVEIDGVSRLTCAQPITALRAVVRGGIPPYRVEWRGAGGVPLGTADELLVSEPGVYVATVRSVGGCQVGQQVTITGDFEAPAVGIEVQGALGCEITEVPLTATILGGRPPFIIQWFDQAGSLVGEDATVTVVEPGRYRVEVVGANGCVGVADAVVVEERIAPRVEAGPDRVLDCLVPEVLLEGSASGGVPPYAYEWMNGSGEAISALPSARVNEPGVYRLSVTGANGCMASDVVRVDEDISPPALTLAASGAIDCLRTSVSLSVAIDGGRAPFAIEWKGPAGHVLGTSETAIADGPGTYTVTVIGANGCVATGSLEVVENVESPELTVTAEGALTCSVIDVPLRVEVAGGRPPYAVEWRDPLDASAGETVEILADRAGIYTVTVTGANGCSASESVTVEEDLSAPVVEASASGVLTCANPAVQLRAEIRGGRSPYAVVWTNEAGDLVGDSMDITIRAPGVYQVRATGTNGCTSADTVTVSQDLEAPRVEASVTGALSCAVEQVQLQAAVSGGRAPYTIAWSGPAGGPIGDGTESVAVGEPGTYTVTVVGANGCVSTDTVDVSRDLSAPEIEPSVSGAITCDVTLVELQVAIEGGRAPYEITWESPSGRTISREASVSVGQPGTYRVTVTGANGCAASEELVVEQDTEAPQIEANSTGDLSCAAPVVTLAVQIQGGREPYAVAWENASGDSLGHSTAIDVSEPGTYTVTVTGANGCMERASVTVEEDVAAPRLEVSNGGVLTCETDAVLLSVRVLEARSPSVVAWTDSSGLLIGNAKDVLVDTPGIYTVTVTGANGCSTSETRVVEQDISPPTIEATASGELTCGVDMVILEVGIEGGRAPYRVAWLDPSGERLSEAESVQVGVPGVYAVTVTGSNGCSATDEVTVSEDVALPQLEAFVSGDLSCQTPSATLDVVVLGGRPPFDCVWSDCCGTEVGAGREIEVFTPGTYIVTVTGANGCQAAAAVEVFEDMESPDVQAFVSGELTCDVRSVALTAVMQGEWPPRDVVWTNAKGQILGWGESIDVSAPGAYTVTATGRNGCAASAVVTVFENSVSPAFDLGEDRTLTCSESEILLSAVPYEGVGPFTYHWTDSCDGVVGISPTLRVTLPGTYRVTVTGANGCPASADIEVFSDFDIPEVQAVASGELTCDRRTVTLTATVDGARPPYELTWTDASGSVLGWGESLAVSQPGAYTVTAVGGNGCGASSSVAVYENTLPPAFDLGEDRSLTCVEPEILLSAVPYEGVGPFTYLWTDSCDGVLGIAPTLRVTLPGTYWVTVTGANGCALSDSISIGDGVNPPMVNLGPDRDMACCGKEMLLECVVTGGMQPYTYEWRDDCDNVIGTGDSVTIAQPGSYLLIVRTADGCIGSDTIIVR